MASDRLKPTLGKINLGRALFGVVLLGSTLYLQLGRAGAPESLSAHYVLILLIGAQALVCAVLLRIGRRLEALAHVQIIADTVTVTLILFATGGCTSPFSFLYLVVVVVSSLVLPRRGTVAAAALCGLQLGALAALEYHGLLRMLDGDDPAPAAAMGPEHVLGKVAVILVACLVVALLSSFLAEQAARSRHELQVMAARVRRVEKLATVGEMAAGLAHEIRNPLSALTGAIQMMREELRCTPDQEHLMRIILREADRLGALVSNFLLYARPPAGRPVPVDLGRVLSETLELFARTGTVQGRVALRVDPGAGLWAELDPGHLRQVLWNLLVNAAEAIDGPGEIRVGVDPAGTREVRLTVADTGHGMAPETLRSIFDPFFSTKPNGTGLGLSIVQRLLDANDCRLDVESDAGRGTTFTLLLPRTPPPTPPSSADRRPSSLPVRPDPGLTS